MKGTQKTQPSQQRGVVLSTNRRSVRILNAEFQELSGQVATKALDVTVGDSVLYSTERSGAGSGGEAFVEEAETAKNCLTRVYSGEVRRIVANVDHLFIGAAIPPLFNTTFIDRLLALARLEEIPATLLINKIDLGTETVERLIALYEKLGVDLLLTSALRGDGVEEIRTRLTDPKLSVVVLAGISGVGKSTIVNVLIPGANQKVGEVSERTGQGKQTTAQPAGHLYARGAGSSPVVLVDLPGIQSYGVSHLQRAMVSAGFVEIEERQQQCAFSDCSHTKENECAVKDAVRSGEIAESRYRSYCDILAEIDAAKRY